MGPLDAVGHLLNFLLPAAGVGMIAAGLAKLLWRRALAAARWWRLARWAAGAAALALTTGLLLTGRDGAMATYGAMLAASALALWWAGFVRPA